MTGRSDDVELWRLLNTPGIAITPEVVAAYLAAALNRDPQSMHRVGEIICQRLKEIGHAGQ